MEDISRKLDFEPNRIMKRESIKPKKIFELMGAKQPQAKKVKSSGKIKTNSKVKTKKKKGKTGY